MWAFMTTGTRHFLDKIISQHPETQFNLMRSGATTLIYYEDERKKSLFAAGRKFEVLYKHNNIRQFGFISMQNIPVLKEAIPIFEEKFKENKINLEKTSTLIGASLLKEHRKNNYILLTQWLSEKDYETWKKEEEAKESFFANMTRKSAYITSRPFTNTYHVVIDE